MRWRIISSVLVVSVLVGAVVFVTGFSAAATDQDPTASTALPMPSLEPGQPAWPVPSVVSDNWTQTKGDFSSGAVVDRPNAEPGKRISKQSFENALRRHGQVYATRIDGIDGEPDCELGAAITKKYGFDHDPNRMLCVVVVVGEFEIEGPIETGVSVSRMINVYDGDTGAYLGTGTIDLN